MAGLASAGLSANTAIQLAQQQQRIDAQRRDQEMRAERMRAQELSAREKLQADAAEGLLQTAQELEGLRGDATQQSALTRDITAGVLRRAPLPMQMGAMGADLLERGFDVQEDAARQLRQVEQLAARFTNQDLAKDFVRLEGEKIKGRVRDLGFLRDKMAVAQARKEDAPEPLIEELMGVIDQAEAGGRAPGEASKLIDRWRVQKAEETQRFQQWDQARDQVKMLHREGLLGMLAPQARDRIGQFLAFSEQEAAMLKHDPRLLMADIYSEISQQLAADVAGQPRVSEETGLPQPLPREALPEAFGGPTRDERAQQGLPPFVPRGTSPEAAEAPVEPQAFGAMDEAGRNLLVQATALAARQGTLEQAINDLVLERGIEMTQAEFQGFVESVRAEATRRDEAASKEFRRRAEASASAAEDVFGPVPEGMSSGTN